MKELYCSICLKELEREDAPVLTISGAGVPRCLCDSCASDVEAVTEGREYSEIEAAMGRIGENLSKMDIDDPLTLRTLTAIMRSSAERAALIKSGEYDFAKDEEQASDGEMEEIPEELLESEEDKERDEAESVRAAKLDKILNWVWAIVLVGTVAFLVWWFFLR